MTLSSRSAATPSQRLRSNWCRGVYHRARIRATRWLLRATPRLGLVRVRIGFQEGYGGVVGAPRELARARPIDDAKQQVHHQVAPQQPGELLGHLGSLAAEKSCRVG